MVSLEYHPSYLGQKYCICELWFGLSWSQISILHQPSTELQIDAAILAREYWENSICLLRHNLLLETTTTVYTNQTCTHNPAAHTMYAEEVGHIRSVCTRCTNHAIHGRFNTFNPLSQQIIIYIRAKLLYVLTSSGTCVHNNSITWPTSSAMYVHRRVYLFAGLDHWTGLLDWTTGLTFDLILSVVRKTQTN